MMHKSLLCCFFVASAITANGQTKNTVMETAIKPLTCKLTTPELQKRKATVIASLKALVVRRKELENGYEYTFNASDENLDKITEFIKTERVCCDFLSFQVTIGEGVAVLTIAGPGGAKEFLRNEIDL
jgi:hypothetical protein